MQGTSSAANRTPSDHFPPPRAFQALAALAGIIALGTFGYHALEGWSWFESFYMVVITLTTIGYGEVHPLHTSGRALTLALIVSGVSVGAYAITQLTRSVIEGDLRRAIERRRTRSVMKVLSNHFIVVGYGQLGEAVTQELVAANMACCVVDRQDLTGGLGDTPFIHGDATSDAVLELAGIRRARGLAVTISNVAEAILVTLSAHQVRPDLPIVTRVPDPATAEKARRAGATRTVSPNAMGGSHIAHTLFRPNATSFLDLATLAEHDDLLLDELEIAEGSTAQGQSLRELRAREQHEVTIIATRLASGRFVASPSADHRLAAGDVVIAIGQPDSVRSFFSLLGRARSTG